jgi:hypothetical protein
MATATNINNLNVLTFIKDIYLSLKHIDTCFNSYKENIDTRLIKLEDNQQTILDKLNNIEQLLYKINSNTENQVALDKNIEHELLEKMNNLNKTNITEKLELKPEELTFANILENNYNILDINQSLANHNILASNDDEMSSNLLVATSDNKEIQKNKNETLENLLF